MTLSTGDTTNGDNSSLTMGTGNAVSGIENNIVMGVGSVTLMMNSNQKLDYIMKWDDNDKNNNYFTVPTPKSFLFTLFAIIQLS